jgi:hypothetical protein
LGAKINLLVLQILFYSACSFGQNITVLNDTASQYPVGKLSYILRDPSMNLTIKNLILQKLILVIQMMQYG